MIDLSDPEVFFEDHLLPKKTSISTLQITLNKYNLWIEWRRYSLQYRKASSKSNPDDELGLENTISLPYSMYPSDLSFPIFKNIYERFLIARWDYARILFEFDQKRNLKTLDILSEKSAFVIRIYRIWESTTEVTRLLQLKK